MKGHPFNSRIGNKPETTGCAVARISHPPRVRSGFTLVELLVSIVVISILATMVLMAVAGVNEKARADRTKAQISKIHELLMEKWESYQSRRLPPTNQFGNHALKVKLGQTAARPAVLAADRLIAVRELLRIELPSHREDVIIPPKFLVDSQQPGKAYTSTVQQGFLRQAFVATQTSSEAELTSAWTDQHEGAECLYMILSQMRDADISAMEFFAANEIGDVDRDGMKEILDGWGRPIAFLRWAPSFDLTENPNASNQLMDAGLSPLQNRLVDVPNQDDSFDSMKNGTAYGPNFTNDRIRTLFPLVFSAGSDGEFGVQSKVVSGNGAEAWATYQNDPYAPAMQKIGFIFNFTQASDNISNHLLTTN